MAQRSSPGRRIPGEPLSGILRNVAFQARYSDRRRTDIPSITNAAARVESANAATPATSFAVVSEAQIMSQAASEAAYAELQAAEADDAAVASRVAGAELPRNDAATFETGPDGSATWLFEPRGSVPHVTATVVADRPAVATVSALTDAAATVTVWDLSGQPLPGATVTVAALWP